MLFITAICLWTTRLSRHLLRIVRKKDKYVVNHICRESLATNNQGKDVAVESSFIMTDRIQTNKYTPFILSSDIGIPEREQRELDHIQVSQQPTTNADQKTSDENTFKYEAKNEETELYLHDVVEYQQIFTEEDNMENDKIPKTNFLNGLWKMNEQIGLDNLEISIDRSAVRLFFCKECFNDAAETFALYGSVHTDRETLSQCIDIDNNRTLVSPVPEFNVGHVMLSDYARIEIPLCVPVTTCSLKVHWMETCESNPKKVEDVPFLESLHQTDLDIFYILPEGRNTCVHVYTKHFSVIFCTVCKEDVRFQMEAEVFVREGSQAGCPNLHIKMPLLGPYEMLEDCREERYRRMEEVNFKRIDRGKINILKSEQETAMEFQLKPPSNWGHQMDDEGPIFQEEQYMDESPTIECISKRHNLQDDGDIQWKIRCEKPFRGKVAVTINITNVSRRDPTRSKKSRFHTECTIQNRSSTPGSGIAYDEPLKRLIKGLGGRENRINLVKRLGGAPTNSSPDKDESHVDTLSDILRQDPQSFLTKVSKALSYMRIPCNEDVSYFFYNFPKVEPPTQRLTATHTNEQKSSRKTLDETRPKSIDSGPKSDCYESSPVEHDENGAVGGGLQWVDPLSGNYDVHEIGNGYIPGSESGIGISAIKQHS